MHFSGKPPNYTGKIRCRQRKHNHYRQRRALQHDPVTFHFQNKVRRVIHKTSTRHKHRTTRDLNSAINPIPLLVFATHKDTDCQQNKSPRNLFYWLSNRHNIDILRTMEEDLLFIESISDPFLLHIIPFDSVEVAH